MSEAQLLASLNHPNIAQIYGIEEVQGGHVALLALIKYDVPVDSLTLANRLAEEYSVMLAPGSAFGYEHHLRLGIGQRPDIFAERGNAHRPCLDFIEWHQLHLSGLFLPEPQDLGVGITLHGLSFRGNAESRAA